MLSKELLEKIANPGPVDIGGNQGPIVTEMAIELLSLREQLAELKALQSVNVGTIQDELIEKVGVMCDQATNIEEKNVYGHAYCVLKYGILPYLRKQG
ncbi:hypothetical protein RF656_14725 [Yersinia kristensenii]|uniref:hypothetical protein n=1 Tax=Yersinia kristensenii TaxID=28152 RepID=UPI002853043E|nr:hypothetical protein [Yersinia kristensenii]MDR4897986.1 hypothetical protein [Yersinia kristensenii]MDX6737164.1 hypothetical protein [Yersinia kristensenii]